MTLDELFERRDETVIDDDYMTAMNKRLAVEEDKQRKARLRLESDPQGFLRREYIV